MFTILKYWYYKLFKANKDIIEDIAIIEEEENTDYNPFTVVEKYKRVVVISPLRDIKYNGRDFKKGKQYMLNKIEHKLMIEDIQSIGERTNES